MCFARNCVQKYVKILNYANLFDCLMWNVECLRIFFVPLQRNLIVNRKYYSTF